ncbi:hypothetical protein ET445_06050 [Agromyces protaetiae]|uniref:Uncharacterized protein n=1 Tax=Agromyces protaetiae TaxID=2509455 RepID=A0A4V0YGZ9_9MICO|nr:hypothetical protein [Agromyces protaetiae]QAY72971.1 hypothetical protein ET445_06050 [Agromyces protaetiae]
MSGEPPVWGGGALDEGPLWSGLMAWTGLVLGIGAIALAVFAPLGASPAGIAWVAGFGVLAIWFGWAGRLGLRRRAAEASAASDASPGLDATRRAPLGAAAGLVGAVLGVIVVVLMFYAWIAVTAADGGVQLPILPAWQPSVEAPTPGEVAALVRSH